MTRGAAMARSRLELSDVLVLLEDGPASAAVLAGWLGCAPADAVTALEALEASELVEPVPVGVEIVWRAVAGARSTLSVPIASPQRARRGRRQASVVQPDLEVEAEAESDGDPGDDVPDLSDLEPFDEYVAPRRAGRPPARKARLDTRVSAGPSWWVGKSREELSAAARERQDGMSNSREAKKVSSGVRV